MCVSYIYKSIHHILFSKEWSFAIVTIMIFFLFFFLARCKFEMWVWKRIKESQGVFFLQSPLFFGPPLCQNPYPPIFNLLPFELCANVASCVALARPLALDEMEEVANGPPPPQQAAWLGVLDHTLDFLAGHFITLVFLWDFAFVPWGNTILFKLDWYEWLCIEASQYICI